MLLPLFALVTGIRADAAPGGSWAAGITAGFALDHHVHAWADALAPEGSTLSEASRYLTELGGPIGISVGIAALYSADTQAGIEAATAVAYAAAATYGLKTLFGRARPDEDEAGFHGLSFSDARHSFPSGHAAVSFAFATVLGRHIPRLREEALAAAAIVSLTRILLDRHWASDVVFGAALGSLVGEAVGAGRLGFVWEW